jgi:hypothetical protein
MPNNQFKKGELYSFITGKASTAIARNLQKKFAAAGLKITIEQWSVLYHLWKEDGKSQQELCVPLSGTSPASPGWWTTWKNSSWSDGWRRKGPPDQPDLCDAAGA